MADDIIKFRITLPIAKAYSSDNYGLIIVDNSGITHYWDFDGNYDGYSHATCVDGETGANLN